MGGAAAWVAELGHTLPSPLTLSHHQPPSPPVRLAVAGGSWPPEARPHTRIWYPLRSGMALGSEGFFSPEGL